MRYYLRIGWKALLHKVRRCYEMKNTKEKPPAVQGAKYNKSKPETVAVKLFQTGRKARGICVSTVRSLYLPSDL